MLWSERGGGGHEACMTWAFYLPSCREGAFPVWSSERQEEQHVHKDRGTWMTCELLRSSCCLDQGSSFLHPSHPMPSAPVCWTTACDRLSSTSVVLFLFHIRCEDLRRSRPAAGGNREARGFAPRCCPHQQGWDVAG